MSPEIRKWPRSAKVVVSVAVHVDGPSVAIGEGTNAMGRHSWGSYAIRRGVPRYLEMLHRMGIAGTFFCCGYDIENWPQTYRDIAAAGHELAADGWLHEDWIWATTSKFCRSGRINQLLTPQEDHPRMVLPGIISCGDM